MDLSSNSNKKKLKCQEHKKNDCKNKLACSKCNVGYKLDYSYIQDIEQLLQQKQNTIFENLPPGILEQLISQLNNHNIQNSSKDELINEVERLFEKYTEAILSSIKEHKIQIINQINIIEDQRMSVIKTYNILSLKEELQKIIKELSHNPQQLENYLKDIIQQKKQSLERDEKQIKVSLQAYSNETDKINLQYSQNNLLSILEKVRSTCFLQSSVQMQQPPQPLIQQKIQIESIQKLQEIKNIQINLLPINNQSNQAIPQMDANGQINYFQNQVTIICNSGVINLSKAFKQMKQLSNLRLHLQGNYNITEEGINQLCKALQDLKKTMVCLDLSLNENANITDYVIVSHVIPLIQTYYKLQHLELTLNNTKISGNTVRQIANALKLLSNLNTLILNFSINQIKDENAFILLSDQIICMKQSLIKVELLFDQNQLCNKGALSLLNALSTCDQLKQLWLDLDNNKISEQCKKQLQSIQQKMTNNSKNLSKFTIYLN